MVIDRDGTESIDYFGIYTHFHYIHSFNPQTWYISVYLCHWVEERVVGNLEEPRAEAASVLIACRREVSLHQRVLRQVVGIALIAAAKGEQEATKCLLLTLYQGDELLACHLFSACITSDCSSASISLASIRLPT